MKSFTYLTIALLAIITIVIGIKTMVISVTALGFIAWAVSPYGYLAVMAKFVSNKDSNIIVLILSLFIGCFGLFSSIDQMFINPDALGGMIYIITPLWQWLLILFATITVYYFNKKVKNA
jgi:hypothetical protein